MPKQFGHTKTLFIQAGKYKWSYKYEHCTVCGGVQKKHKGRGLCTSCWDKERDKTEKRKLQKRNIAKNWHEKHYERKPKSEWKKMGPPKTRTEEEKKQYHREWARKNRWKHQILKRGKKKKSEGLPVMEYRGFPLDIDISIAENFEKFKKLKKWIDKKIQRTFKT